MSTEKLVGDAATTALKVTESAIKKAWTIMDAATQKERPSQALSPQAIKAIQGPTGPAGS